MENFIFCAVFISYDDYPYKHLIILTTKLFFDE